jgi:hypothetical protein
MTTREALDAIAWIIMRVTYAVGLVAGITYGMTGWAEW